MDSQETSALSADKAFQKLLQPGERLLSAYKLIKFNKRNRTQERTLAITTHAMMNLKGRRLKRRIEFTSIAGATKSAPGEEFIIHIPNEYDYRFSCHAKDEIINELGSAYKENQGRILYLWISYEPTIKDLATTKSDKKKGISKIQSPETASNFRQAMEESGSGRNGRSQTIFAANDSEDVTLNDFKILKVIGRGAFGKVMLVEKSDTREPYAMKSLRKDALIEKDQVEHTLTEKKIMQHINHPLLVRLEYAFTTVDKIYFVMAFLRGGELFFHLKNKGRFSEDEARFIAACVALGLGHLHSQNVAYRDLKPENILLNDQGYAHLTDFGMAKFLPEGGSTQSFVGTPEYLAPEIIAGTGHDTAADWWSFGILIYEMMAGAPPFYNQNIQLMYDLIQVGDLRFPQRNPFSPEAEDIVRQLLNRDPRARPKLNDIKNHPFFRTLDWDALLDKRLIAPFSPNVSGPKTVENVDEEFTSEDAVNSLVPEHQLKMVQQNQEQFNGFN